MEEILNFLTQPLHCFYAVSLLFIVSTLILIFIYHQSPKNVITVSLPICFTIFLLLLAFFSNFSPIFKKDEHSVFYDWIIIFTTITLVLIAWFKLTGVNKNLSADYLLKIDERWSSPEIIEARLVIHGIYRKCKLDLYNDTEKLGDDQRKKLHDNIGNEIIKLSKSQDRSEQKMHMYLLNFLDFMETVGYLYASGYVEKKVLNDLFGISLEFNYEIYNQYIEHRRESHNNNKFYERFQKLYNDIKDKKSHMPQNGKNMNHFD